MNKTLLKSEVNYNTLNNNNFFKEIKSNGTRIFQWKYLSNKKVLLAYKGTKLALTSKQIAVLSLVSKGYSNSKIANEFLIKPHTVKQTIHRLIKSLENTLYQHLDRFSLVIFAQELDLNT